MYQSSLRIGQVLRLSQWILQKWIFSTRYRVDVGVSCSASIVLELMGVDPHWTSIHIEMYSTSNVACIACNFNADSAAMQSALEGDLVKLYDTTYGPGDAQKHLYFVDDLNLCGTDAYGTQSAVELLRQHVDHGFLYDRRTFQDKTVETVGIC